MKGPKLLIGIKIRPEKSTYQSKSENVFTTITTNPAVKLITTHSSYYKKKSSDFIANNIKYRGVKKSYTNQVNSNNVNNNQVNNNDININEKNWYISSEQLTKLNKTTQKKETEENKFVHSKHRKTGSKNTHNFKIYQAKNIDTLDQIINAEGTNVNISINDKVSVNDSVSVSINPNHGMENVQDTMLAENAKNRILQKIKNNQIPALQTLINTAYGNNKDENILKIMQATRQQGYFKSKDIFKQLNKSDNLQIKTQDIPILMKGTDLLLSHNRQNLLVSNNKQLFALKSRLEYDVATRRTSAYWEYISLTDSTKFKGDYETLTETEKEKLHIFVAKKNTILELGYIKNKLLELKRSKKFLNEEIDAARENLAKEKNENLPNFQMNNQGKSDFLNLYYANAEKKIEELQQKEQTTINDLTNYENFIIEKLGREEFNKNFNVNITELENLDINIIADKIHESYINANPEQKMQHTFFNQSIIFAKKEFNDNVIDETITQLETHPPQSKNRTGLHLDELLHLLAGNSQEISLAAGEAKGMSAKSKNISSKFNGLLNEANPLGRVFAVSSLLNKNLENLTDDEKKEQTILKSIAKFHGQDFKTFLKNNITFACNINILKNHCFEDLLKNVDNIKTGQVIHLNKVYKYQNIESSKIRLNGSAPLQAINNFLNAENKAPMVLESKNLKTYNNIYLLEYKNNGWTKKNILTNKINNIPDINNFLKDEAKNNSILYTPEFINTDRDLQRFDYAYVSGRQSNILFNKIKRDKYVYSDERAEKGNQYMYTAVQISGEKKKYKEDKEVDKYQNKGGKILKFVDKNCNPWNKRNHLNHQMRLKIRNAFFCKEDVLRKVWGELKAGATQPQDSIVTHTLRTFSPMADTTWARMLSSNSFDVFLQLAMDDVQTAIYGNRINYSPAVTAGTIHNTGEMKTASKDLINIVKNNAHLSDKLIQMMEDLENKDMPDNMRVDEAGKIFIDGKDYDTPQDALNALSENFINNVSLAKEELKKSQSQNKYAEALGPIDQLLQSVVRMTWIALMSTIGSPIKKLVPGMNRIDLLVRRVFQTVAAGIDNHNRQFFLLRAQIDQPTHLMKDEAIDLGLDKILTSMPFEEFEKEAVNRICQAGYYSNGVEAMMKLPQLERDTILQNFLFDHKKMHSNISYNATTRASMIERYATHKFSGYEIERIKLEQVIEKIDQQTRKKNNINDRNTDLSTIENEKTKKTKSQFKTEIKKIEGKIELLKQEYILFQQGLEYANANSHKPPKDVPQEWKLSWAVLEKNFPKGKLVKLIKAKTPMQIVRKSISIYLNEPGEALIHGHYRRGDWPILDLGITMDKFNEKLHLNTKSSEIVNAVIKAPLIGGTVMAGVADYVTRGTNVGFPNNHFKIAIFFMQKLTASTSAMNNRYLKLEQSLRAKNLNEKEKQIIKQELAEIRQDSKNSNELIDFLENSIEPDTAISKLKYLTKVPVVDTETKKLAYVDITEENLKVKTTETLVASMSRFLPPRPHEAKIQKNGNFNDRANNLRFKPTNTYMANVKHSINMYPNNMYPNNNRSTYWDQVKNKVITYNNTNFIGNDISEIVKKASNGFRKFDRNAATFQNPTVKTMNGAEKLKYFESYSGVTNPEDTYLETLDKLYNSIPNINNDDKFDHSANRYYFIGNVEKQHTQVIKDIEDIKFIINEKVQAFNLGLTQAEINDPNRSVSQIIKERLGENTSLTQDIFIKEIKDLELKQKNYKQLYDDLTQFLNKYKEKDSLQGNIKLDLNSIQYTSEGVLINIKKLHPNSILNHNKKAFNINIESSYRFAELVKRGPVSISKFKNKYLRKGTQKAKGAVTWTYDRILNPFGHKSISAMFLNPVDKRWIPYTVARQGIMTAAVSYEFIVKNLRMKELSKHVESIGLNEKLYNNNIYLFKQKTFNIMDRQLIEAMNAPNLSATENAKNAAKSTKELALLRNPHLMTFSINRNNIDIIKERRNRFINGDLSIKKLEEEHANSYMPKEINNVIQKHIHKNNNIIQNIDFINNSINENFLQEFYRFLETAKENPNSLQAKKFRKFLAINNNLFAISEEQRAQADINFISTDTENIINSFIQENNTEEGITNKKQLIAKYILENPNLEISQKVFENHINEKYEPDAKQHFFAAATNQQTNGQNNDSSTAINDLLPEVKLFNIHKQQYPRNIQTEQNLNILLEDFYQKTPEIAMKYKIDKFKEYSHDNADKIKMDAYKVYIDRKLKQKYELISAYTVIDSNTEDNVAPAA